MQTKVIIHKDFTVAAVDPRIFGVHLGAPGGSDHAAVADPHHPAADESGLRTDVLDLARAYRLPCMLGLSDTEGPARGANARGDIRIDGLVDWCCRTGAEPMLSLPVDDVADRHHGLGLGERHGVRMWHLGRVDDETPEAPLEEVAARVRSFEPSATLVLGAAFADPERAIRVLDRHRHAVDLVSLPGIGLPVGPVPSAARRLDRSIDAIVARLDRSRTVDRCGRPIGIQVDLWGEAPGRDPASALDRALAMNVLIRRADRVRTAFAANVLSGLASILSPKPGMGPRADLFDPLLAGSLYGRGVSLMPAVRGTLSESEEGEALADLDVSAVWDEEVQALSLFLVNRGDAETAFDVDLHGFARMAVGEHRLASPSPRMPGLPPAGPRYEGGRLSWSLPANSYAVVRLVHRNS